MPELDRLSPEELLRRGVAAARVGEADESRAFLDELLRREPENAEAWLWLGTVAATPQARRDAFERCLELRPGDPEAQDGLARLAEKYGQGLLAERETDLTSLRCTWHPDRETMLRCSRCDRPMCPDCARQHPVGLRCKECMRELRSPLYKVGPAQLLRGFATGLVAWTLAAALLFMLPLWILFTIFLAIAAGPMVADVVSRGAGRKRGRSIQWATLASLLVALSLFWGLALNGLAPLPVDPLTSLVLLAAGGASAWRRLE